MTLPTAKAGGIAPLIIIFLGGLYEKIHRIRSQKTDGKRGFASGRICGKNSRRKRDGIQLGKCFSHSL
nr:MAG TPA: hypothetical protein [Caudoviricetes sp.]